MKYFRSVYWLFAVILLLVGCSAGDGSSSSSSRVVFQMPEGFSNESFSGNACFAVNITANNITGVAPGSCDLQYGVFGGLIKAGEAIELTASYGQSRAIDIYLVISENPCSQFDPAQGMGKVFGSNNVFRIGRTENVNFDKPDITVEVAIEYPNASNSLASLASVPASCIQGGGLTSIKQARVVLGNYRGTTNAGSQVHVRVLDKKIKIKKPTNFSETYLKPVRLGVDQ